jgi:hypothetical protein
MKAPLATAATMYGYDLWFFTREAAILLCGASLLETGTNRHDLAAQNARAVTCGASRSSHRRENNENTRTGRDQRLEK